MVSLILIRLGKKILHIANLLFNIATDLLFIRAHLPSFALV